MNDEFALVVFVAFVAALSYPLQLGYGPPLCDEANCCRSDEAKPPGASTKLVNVGLVVGVDAVCECVRQTRGTEIFFI